MSAMLRELLEGIIDYAGLFPPAKLPMADALEEYRRLCGGGERWIVNRFLCPASRLGELSESVGASDRFSVGVIGSAGEDLDAFRTGLESSARAMTDFDGRFGDQLPIEAFEVRMPLDATVETVANDLRGFADAEVFLELPWGEDLEDQLAAVASTDWLGAKGRTGGISFEAFPSAPQLAGFLKSCQDLDLAFKLTAGLHHPVRTFDSTLGVWQHGFASILAALALNDANALSRSEMACVLESDCVEWEDGAVRWEGVSASLADASEVRSLFQGFGSCSVNEPLQDLNRLGLLNGVSA